MAQRVIAENARVSTVTYTLPNKHYIPVNMDYIGVDNVTPLSLFSSLSCVIYPHLWTEQTRMYLFRSQPQGASVLQPVHRDGGCLIVFQWIDSSDSFTRMRPWLVCLSPCITSAFLLRIVSTTQCAPIYSLPSITLMAPPFRPPSHFVFCSESS